MIKTTEAFKSAVNLWQLNGLSRKLFTSIKLFPRLVLSMTFFALWIITQNNLFRSLNSFDMASSDTTPGTGDHSNYSTVSASEPRRKVSILADPPAHNAAGYDNLGYVGAGRKISQVRIKIKC